jgi:hypothetical protein
VLALQVELCLPRLMASRVETRWRPLGLSAGALAAGPVQRVYSSLSAFRAKGRRVVPVAGLMAKIRKWLGLGKKS